MRDAFLALAAGFTFPVVDSDSDITFSSTRLRDCAALSGILSATDLIPTRNRREFGASGRSRIDANCLELDAPRGFEPRLTESESVVLPLDDGATAGARDRCGPARCQRLNVPLR